jgi:hypothetical protein
MILVGKPEGDRQLEQPRSELEYNIKMFLKKIVSEGMDWVHLAQESHK